MNNEKIGEIAEQIIDARKTLSYKRFSCWQLKENNNEEPDVQEWIKGIENFTRDNRQVLVDGVEKMGSRLERK